MLIELNPVSICICWITFYTELRLNSKLNWTVECIDTSRELNERSSNECMFFSSWGFLDVKIKCQFLCVENIVIQYIQLLHGDQN